MPKILNYENFCEELDEVTSLKTFGKKSFILMDYSLNRYSAQYEIIPANVVLIMEFQKKVVNVKNVE